MLTVLLKIPGILGIALLVLLGAILAVALIVLFFPITYRLEGKRELASPGAAGDGQTFRMTARVRINWLFGLLRVRFCYPSPGELTVKLLWFQLFGSSGEREGARRKDQNNKKNKKKGQKSASEEGTRPAAGEDREKRAEGRADAPDRQAEQDSAAGQPAGEEAQSGQEAPQAPFFEKIECTIRKLCDTIKKIWEDVAFYKELLLCDDTRGLAGHAFGRLGRILKCIRPRKLSADILFGAGSPDTTGYVLGVYGVLSPGLGGKVNLTPDFTQAIFTGEVSAAGHIMVFQLLRHGVMVLLDRRLRGLTRKLRTARSAGRPYAG